MTVTRGGGKATTCPPTNSSKVALAPAGITLTILRGYTSAYESASFVMDVLQRAVRQAAVERFLKKIQSYLNFEQFSNNPEFATRKGVGRVATVAFALGTLLGVHALAWFQLTLYLSLQRTDEPEEEHGDDDASSTTFSSLLLSFLYRRIPMAWQWCGYVSCLCAFHLLEFFVTALYNPTTCTADSFLVNHSLAYTAAAMSSWCEFGIRFWLFPAASTAAARTIPSASKIGLLVVVAAQIVRSTAMATAGESFNHYIQLSRKENHALVTRGIFKYLRHPSYVGFFYWSVGTQLLLGNYLHAAAYAVASYQFFKRRIEYEERSLRDMFPDEYPAYVRRTYSGIPGIRTRIAIQAADTAPKKEN